MLKIPLPRSRNVVLGAFIFAFSLYTLLNRELVFGIPSLLLAIIVATTYNYIVLDFAAGYQGKFTFLCSITPLGGWERLPPAQHLILKRFSEFIKDDISNSGVYQTVRQQRYLVMLSVPDSKEAFLLLEVPNLNEARSIAHKISLTGSLELKDYTQ